MTPTACRAAVTWALLCACGHTGNRVTFRRTDPAFQPVPGATPRVYFDDDVDQVPDSRLRSVGVIEVSVPAPRGRRGAADRAVEKGRELGCWILVEHAAFESLRSRTSVMFGARIYLAHGGPPHVDSVTPPLRVEFDCVVRGDASQRI